MGGRNAVKHIAAMLGQEDATLSLARLISQRNNAAISIVERGNFLLDSGDRYFGTPLFAACYVLWPRMVERLLKLGADHRHCAPWGAGGAAGGAVIGSFDLAEVAHATGRPKILFRCVKVLDILRHHGALEFFGASKPPAEHVMAVAAMASSLGQEEIARVLWQRSIR